MGVWEGGEQGSNEEANSEVYLLFLNGGRGGGGIGANKEEIKTSPSVRYVYILFLLKGLGGGGGVAGPTGKK